jgi:sugar diacid utilization regulator
MAKKICKGSEESEDVAHFAISSFMEHERGQELVDAGRGMQFLSGIIWRSFNSSTSEYHSIYRQKGRMHEIKEHHLDAEDQVYDHNQDVVVGAIQGILEDMEADRTDLWYRATLFQMYLQNPNFSELARKTNIPRNSISHAVEECRVYIKEQLKLQNIEYDI